MAVSHSGTYLLETTYATMLQTAAALALREHEAVAQRSVLVLDQLCAANCRGTHDSRLMVAAMPQLTDLPPELIMMILEYIVSDIPGYWGTFTEINNLLRASVYCLAIARTVCNGIRHNSTKCGSLMARSEGWDWKVATAFIIVDAEVNKKGRLKNAFGCTTEKGDKEPSLPLCLRLDLPMPQKGSPGTVGGRSTRSVNIWRTKRRRCS